LLDLSLINSHAVGPVSRCPAWRDLWKTFNFVQGQGRRKF